MGQLLHRKGLTIPGSWTAAVGHMRLGGAVDEEMVLTDVANAADSDRITGDILKVAGVVVLGAIMSILDITVVNVALPTFQTTFGSAGHPLAYSTVAWTVTGYTLALATVIPITGWAADRFGTKRLYMAAVALFTAGSVLCSVASSISMLISFRVPALHTDEPAVLGHFGAGKFQSRQIFGTLTDRFAEEPVVELKTRYDIAMILLAIYCRYCGIEFLAAGAY